MGESSEVYRKEMNFNVPDWIHLVKGRFQWMAVVNALINFRFHEGGKPD
jgi:hypothetical protein